jgi:GNAT superfamily N-acetyltransferase
MTIFIERRRELSGDSLADLITESERAGLQFVRRLVEEWVNGANRFDHPGEALFAVWVDGQLVGVCGLNVNPYAAQERIGRVRHLYVLSAFRRLGVGRHLVTQVIETARGRFDILRLRTMNPAAAQFYEASAFVHLEPLSKTQRTSWSWRLHAQPHRGSLRSPSPAGIRRERIALIYGPTNVEGRYARVREEISAVS